MQRVVIRVCENMERGTALGLGESRGFDHNAFSIYTPQKTFAVPASFRVQNSGEFTTSSGGAVIFEHTLTSSKMTLGDTRRVTCANSVTLVTY